MTTMMVRTCANNESINELQCDFNAVYMIKHKLFGNLNK